MGRDKVPHRLHPATVHEAVRPSPLSPEAQVIPVHEQDLVLAPGKGRLDHLVPARRAKDHVVISLHHDVPGHQWQAPVPAVGQHGTRAHHALDIQQLAVGVRLTSHVFIHVGHDLQRVVFCRQARRGHHLGKLRATAARGAEDRDHAGL